MKSLNPNDLGKTFLVEECQKIEINTFLRRAKNGLKEALINSELTTQGIAIELATSITGLGGTRHWFKCPICHRRVGTLFVHPVGRQVGCRTCSGLEYRKRRFKGMTENQTNYNGKATSKF